MRKTIISEVIAQGKFKSQPPGGPAADPNAQYCRVVDMGFQTKCILLPDLLLGNRYFHLILLIERQT